MSGQSLVYHPGLRFILMTMLTLTTGSAFIMWLGEQISDRGIGNGMSLIIFAGIVVGLPRAVADLWDKAKTEQWGSFTPIALIALLALMVAVVAFIVFVEGGQRRIPVQYAKRVMGRKVMGGQMTYLPLRVNSGGVIPPIFASSLAHVSADAGADFPEPSRRFYRRWRSLIRWGEPLYTLHVRDADHLFRVFLRGHHFQSHGACRQHAQVRRVHSGHPSGPQHVRTHQPNSDAAHACRRRLSRDRLLAARSG